jgi:small basic protein (TIGR04137 family)
MDKSLRVRAGMLRARNVLTRDERILRLRDAERWQEGDSPLGLPKVRVFKLALKQKKKKKKEEEEGAEAGAAADTATKAAGAGGKAAGAKAPAAKAPAAKGKK